MSKMMNRKEQIEMASFYHPANTMPTTEGIRADIDALFGHADAQEERIKFLETLLLDVRTLVFDPEGPLLVEDLEVDGVKNRIDNALSPDKEVQGE